jgi:hypothetical protein
MSNIELYEAVDNGFPSKPLSNPEPGTFPIRYIFARAPRKSIGAFAAHPSLKKLTKIIFQKGPGYEQSECASRRRATSDAASAASNRR